MTNQELAQTVAAFIRLRTIERDIERQTVFYFNCHQLEEEITRLQNELRAEGIDVWKLTD